ncbi:BTAD domain-containing putative transcriptional regulator [Streptomyces varsoviensis]|uniref:AfsR/SARP family transcriptional regulator n=1 Tax=Streptomyces varsoviensis TaxID=67373 RepID=UPI003402A777
MHSDEGGPGTAPRFKLLGPVRAELAGRPLKLGPPQQRAALAVLLLRDGRSASLVDLMAALWGEEPPPRAVGTLRTYISRLRSLLEPARRAHQPSRLLVSTPDGYALRIPDGLLDAAEFERRLAAAARARAAGDPAAGHRELRQALALWDGTALAGLPGPYAERERDRLGELRVTAREDLFDFALRLGRHADTVAELRAFAAEHPLRERAQGLLMQALHRGGRQAEALAVYAETRRILAGGLGVEPGPELAALHTTVLAGEPSLPPTPEPLPPEPLLPEPLPEPPGALSGTGPGVPPGAGPGALPSPLRSPSPSPVPSHPGIRPEALPEARIPAQPTTSPQPASSPQPAATAPQRAATAPQPAGTPPQPAAAPPVPPEPAPGPAPGAEPPPAAHLPLPAQLPYDIADFVGRESVVEALCDTLLAADGRAVPVATLTGLAGVGKTALAVHAAHAVRAAFPDGQLYVDLRGGDPDAMSSSAALAHFLRALGVADAELPRGLDQQAALYRSLLAGRRMLVLLDNARDTRQVRPLLPGALGCAVLVTSRSRTITLSGARLVDVELLPERDALALLAAIAGPDRVAVEPVASRELVAACGRLPLAVRIAAARLAARPSWAVADLAARLRDERHRLDELRVDDLGVECAFRLGYAALSDDLARAFRLASLADVPAFSAASVAELLGVDAGEAERMLEGLVDAGLAEVRYGNRYGYHDLLRLFARRQSESTDGPEERSAALLRQLDHVLATVVTAMRRIRPHSIVPDHLHRTTAKGRDLPDAEAAREWLWNAHPQLHGAVRQAVAGRRAALRPAVDLLVAWADLVQGTARRHGLEPLVREALEAARRHGDDRSTARVLRLLGAPHYGLQTHDRAQSALRESRRLAEAAGDLLTRAEAAQDLGAILTSRGRPAESIPPFEQARELFEAMGAPSDAAHVRALQARAYSAMGRSAEAAAATREAVTRARELGHPDTLAHVLYHVGSAALADGRPADAFQYLHESRRRHHAARDLRWEAICWARLAHAELAAGRPEAALGRAEKALAMESGLGDAFCSGLARAAHGRALLRTGHRRQALATLRCALADLQDHSAHEAAHVAALLAATEGENSAA